MFAKGHLYKILSNKVYIGKLQHADKEYEGQHEAIISKEVFDKVQKMIEINAVNRKHELYSKNGFLLMGLLYDDVGNKMITTSCGGKKRYRYYAINKNNVEKTGELTKIPAGEIETFAKERLLELLKDKSFIQDLLSRETVETQITALDLLDTFEPDKLFIRNAINRIDLRLENIKITYDINYITQYLIAKINNDEIPLSSKIPLLESFRHDVKITQTPKRKNKIIISGKANYDMTLIQALIKSFWYNKMGAERKLPPEARNGNNKKLRKLRFLPPDIIESIMNGTQDPNLTIRELIEIAKNYV